MRENRLKLSYGNTKLPKTTAIFNMGSAIDCPSDKLGLCQLANSSQCYAKKAEKMYKQVLPYRRAQAKYWLECTPSLYFFDFLTAINRKRNPIRALRFNESGDFYSQACVDKLSKIADLLATIKVKVYTYTARRDLDYSNISDNLTVNGSGYMADNMFIALPAKLYDKSDKKGFIPCPMDCNKCSLCTRKAGKVIAVKMH